LNSKVIGSFLILGPLLLVIPWFTLGVDASGMSPTEHIAAVLEKSTQSQASGILNVFGAIFLFTGLYYLAKSLKSDDSSSCCIVTSNSLAAIGGLLLILCLPLFVTLVGAELIAIDAAKEFGNDVGATILAASTGLQMCGFLMIIGLFLVGASLTLKKKYKGIVGALFMIVTILAFIDIISGEATGEVVSIIGWMGMFLMTLITGILTIVTTLQKENQS